MKTHLTATSLILLFLLSLTSPLAATSLGEPGSPSANTSARATACSGSVCINEVIPNPNGADDANYPNGEWFELYNNGGMDVDLTGLESHHQREQSAGL